MPVPALNSPLINSGKGWLWCSALSFTTVEDDPHIEPVLKMSAQFCVPVQTIAGHYEEEHAYVPAGRSVIAQSGPATTALERT